MVTQFYEYSKNHKLCTLKGRLTLCELYLYKGYKTFLKSNLCRVKNTSPDVLSNDLFGIVF